MEEKKFAASSSSASVQKSERSSPPVPRASPWLVFPHGKGKGTKDQAFFNLCDPNKQTYLKSIPEMRFKSYWQSPSHKGWLVLLCDDHNNLYSNSIWKFGDCFLWNPVSMETIRLPTLLHWLNNKPKQQYYISDCVLTSPPQSNDDDDSMVSFLFTRDKSPKNVLVFCCPGDKQWRKQEVYEFENEESCKYLFSFKGKLFLATYNRHLEFGKLQLGSDDKSKTLSITSYDVNNNATFLPMGGDFDVNVHTYYLESCDELFQVSIIFYRRGCHEQVVKIEVCRLDFSLMAWEDVKSLGDHVLFLGQNTTVSCSASELGLARGFLYYTLPNDKNLYRFDLENRRILFSLPCPKLPTPWLSPAWMMIPTIDSVIDGRKTECMLGNDEEKDNIIEAKENKTSINDDVKEDQGQLQNEGALEETRAYGILNEDIWELVASYLHPVDYIHFRAACKANRSFPKLNSRISSTRIAQTTSLSPWLVLSGDKGTIYNFVDPMHSNEKYLMNLPELLLGATIRFSKGGWLLMSKGYNTLFFYNPFTRLTIPLPDLPEGWPYMFSGISFSSLPTSSDCVLFAYGKDSNYQFFIFFIGRGDNRWRHVVTENQNYWMEFQPCLNNPVFYDGAFYCLDRNGTLGVFNSKDSFCLEVLDNPQPPCKSVYQCFLVECEGKLLSVFVGHVGKWVQIFRLDFSKMVWVEVESLGKHILFISDTSCLSAIAPKSCMENKIYFPRLQGEGILFYSLDICRYQSIESQSSAKDFYNTEEELYCSWIEPSWSETTVQELDWLSI